MVFRASTASFTSLQSYVEPELLRGVPLHECLSGWGKHWQQAENAMLCTDRSAYDLGKQIEEYDVFLSHDWATSRYLKLFSMMIIFNSRAAFFLLLCGQRVDWLPTSLSTDSGSDVDHLFRIRGLHGGPMFLAAPSSTLLPAFDSLRGQVVHRTA